MLRKYGFSATTLLRLQGSSIRSKASAPHSIATRRRRRRAFGLPRAVLKKSRSTNYPIFARDLELSASRARPQPGAGNSLTKRNALTRRFPKAVLSRESRCRFRTLITRDFVQKQRGSSTENGQKRSQPAAAKQKKGRLDMKRPFFGRLCARLPRRTLWNASPARPSNA